MTNARGLIIHIEDEPGMSELVFEILEGEGWTVKSALTGREGLRLLLECEADLLLLDYALPDMLGTVLIDELISRGGKPPPFVVTTGMGDEQLAVKMMKRGAADYLVKDGRFLEQLATVVHRVANETALARRLAKSELQLQFLAQHSTDILTIADARAVPRYLSPAAETLTGYSAEELKGPLTELVHPDDQQSVVAFWKRIVSEPGRAERTSFRALHKNGTVIWLEAVVKNQLEDPALEGVIATVRDITERKAAEQQRLEMERRLLHSQKLESLGVLAGGIAHDFNNLLAAVVGNLDLALSDLGTHTEAYLSVDLALKASQRAAELTRQMLAYSGRGAFAVESVDISTLVLDNTQLFDVSVGRNIALLTDVPSGLPAVQADRSQLQQVVMNLLTNASEAIGARNGIIQLRTGVVTLEECELRKSLVEPRSAPGSFVFLSVKDNGCGMSVAVKERLFDPFYTTKRTGRGLGMAAVLGIVRGHHGALFVDSEVGQGTTIQVLFPAEALATSDGVSVVTAPVATTSGGFGATVLVVDDDAAVRSMAARLFRHLGCTPIEASGGREALKVFETDRQVDAIFMDLTMPDMGGLETLSELKRRATCPPVVLCSGFGEGAYSDGIECSGADAFLKKPYRLAELRQVLERVLSRA